MKKLDEKREANQAGEKYETDETGGEETLDDEAYEERQKDHLETLDMLKRELQRMKDGGDPFKFDHLFENESEETKELLKGYQNAFNPDSNDSNTTEEEESEPEAKKTK